MSARDELCKMIQGGLNNGVADYIADALISNGWRKPEPITTEEELDALPTGAVVLADNHRHYLEDWRLSFQKWDDGLWHRGARTGSTHPDNFLPATILYNPKA